MTFWNTKYRTTKNGAVVSVKASNRLIQRRWINHPPATTPRSTASHPRTCGQAAGSENQPSLNVSTSKSTVDAVGIMSLTGGEVVSLTIVDSSGVRSSLTIVDGLVSTAIGSIVHDR